MVLVTLCVESDAEQVVKVVLEVITRMQAGDGKWFGSDKMIAREQAAL